MKKIITLFMFCFAILMVNAQEAQIFLTFEDGKIIPDGVTAVTNVNGTGDAVIKNDGTYTQAPNAITDDNGENVLFMDYHGYLKFDKTIFNKDAFTITANYKWTGNNVWWLGILSVIGYDADGPEDDGLNAGYTAKQLQLKEPSGKIDGLGLSVAETVLPKDEYHHFALTYDMGTIVIYIDGVEVGSATDQTHHTLQNPELYFGVKMGVDATTGDISPSLDGSGNCKSTRVNTDNVGLFNVALTAQEIAAIANGTSVPTDVDGKNIESVKVYPNPFVEVINISGENISVIDVYNMSGVKVKSEKNITGSIETSDLSMGIYLVKCLGSNGEVVQVKKMIKK